jgi:hypothetical protein
MRDVGSLTQADFQGALDSIFEIRPPGGNGAPIAARLVEVKVMRAPEGCEQFSALFIGPVTPAYGQGTYRFAHAALGEVDLFMVPLGLGSTGMQYEVCIVHDRRPIASQR